MASCSSVSALFPPSYSSRITASYQPKTSSTVLLLFMSVLAAANATGKFYPERIRIAKEVGRSANRPKDAVVQFASVYLEDVDSYMMYKSMSTTFTLLSPLEKRLSAAEFRYSLHIDFGFYDRLIERLLLAENRVEESELCRQYSAYCKDAAHNRKKANFDSFIENEVTSIKSSELEGLEVLELAMDENSLHAMTDRAIKALCTTNPDSHSCITYKEEIEAIEHDEHLCKAIGITEEECVRRTRRGEDIVRKKFTSDFSSGQVDFFKIAMKETRRIEEQRARIQAKNSNPRKLNHR